MKKFLNAVYLCVAVAALVVTIAGQSDTRGSAVGKAGSANDGQQIVTKMDKFSGATSITLKPQKVVDTPEQLLTVSAESKVGDKPSIGYEEADERVILSFDLQTTTSNYDAEDLYFLVDRKSVKGGSVASSRSPLLGAKPTSPYTKRRRFTGSVSIPTLRQIARGKRVEMRLGSIEVTLNSDLLNKFGEFVQLYEQAKEKAQP